MASIVGIDLGTTNSCVVMIRNGQVEVIDAVEGGGTRIVASVVSYPSDGGPPVVGKRAVGRIDSENTFFGELR